MTRTAKLIGILLLFTVSARAQEFERRSLSGLKGVKVLVESLAADLTRLGLATELVKTDVELRLRKAGIRLTNEGPYELLSPDPLKWFWDEARAVIDQSSKDDIEKLRLKTILDFLSQLRSQRQEATLYVSVNALESQSGAYIYNVSVEIDQPANASRDLYLYFPSARTWSRATLGLVTPGYNVTATIGQTIQDLVDIFINDYLAANPPAK